MINSKQGELAWPLALSVSPGLRRGGLVWLFLSALNPRGSAPARIPQREGYRTGYDTRPTRGGPLEVNET